MSKSSTNSSKSKMIKNFSTSKQSSVINNSLYSGNTNAQRTLQKPGSLYHHRPTHLKQLNEKGIHEESENISVVEFHPWKPEYKQIFTREKIKKSMTKDPYAQKKRRVAHANEKVVKKEECFLELIPTESVHIETPNIQQATSKVLLPNIVRYVRRRDLLPSERLISRSMVEEFSESQSKLETIEEIPVIQNNLTIVNGRSLTMAERLLNRATLRIDASVIRRPPRRLVINATRETIVPFPICA